MRAQRQRYASASLRDQQHRYRRTDRKCDQDEHADSTNAVRPCEYDHRRQERTRAGNEDEAEARAEQKASAEIAGSATCENCERTFNPPSDCRHDQCKRDDEENAGSDIELVLRGDVESSPDPGTGEREQDERRDQPGDDRVGLAARFRRSTAGEDHG